MSHSEGLGFDKIRRQLKLPDQNSPSQISVIADLFPAATETQTLQPRALKGKQTPRLPFILAIKVIKCPKRYSLNDCGRLGAFWSIPSHPNENFTHPQLLLVKHLQMRWIFGPKL